MSFGAHKCRGTPAAKASASRSVFILDLVSARHGRISATVVAVAGQQARSGGSLVAADPHYHLRLARPRKRTAKEGRPRRLNRPFGTPPAGSVLEATGNTMPRNSPSEKFWLNQLARTTVHSIPASWTMRSQSCASSSPRPGQENQPLDTFARRPFHEGTDGVRRPRDSEVWCIADVRRRHSGSSTASQVLWSPQSKDGLAARDALRVGTPRLASRSTTRRPVLPVPPRTSVSPFENVALLHVFHVCSPEWLLDTVSIDTLSTLRRYS